MGYQQNGWLEHVGTFRHLEWTGAVRCLGISCRFFPWDRELCLNTPQISFLLSVFLQAVMVQRSWRKQMIRSVVRVITVEAFPLILRTTRENSWFSIGSLHFWESLSNKGERIRLEKNEAFCWSCGQDWLRAIGNADHPDQDYCYSG
jgi:hypothetical protein